MRQLACRQDAAWEDVMILFEVFRPSVEESQYFIVGFLVFASLQVSTLGKWKPFVFLQHSLSDTSGFLCPYCI